VTADPAERPPAIGVVAIAGLGLIGGSIALALRTARPDVRILGIDQPDAAAEATRRAIIDEARESIGDVPEADLLVLAAPVPAILSLLSDTARAGFAGAVTDVGSTKRAIMAAATAAGVSRMVGGHPMAGAEHAGLEHATPDLFRGRPWVLVQSDTADSAALGMVDELIVACGASPRRMDAEQHDRVVAHTSHLPQIVSLALMTAAGEACGPADLGVSGRAFAEMTRLASSAPDVWRGILSTNADFVSDAVESFVRSLPRRGALEDAGAIDALFATAREWRDRSRV